MKRCPISTHHSTWRTSLRLERLMIFLDLCRTMYPLWLTPLQCFYHMHILDVIMPLHIPQLFLVDETYPSACSFSFSCMQSLGTGQYTPIHLQTSLVAVSLSKLVLFDNAVNWSGHVAQVRNIMHSWDDQLLHVVSFSSSQPLHYHVQCANVYESLTAVFSTSQWSCCQIWRLHLSRQTKRCVS